MQSFKKYHSFDVSPGTIIARERTDDGTVLGDVLHPKIAVEPCKIQVKRSTVPISATENFVADLSEQIARLSKQFPHVPERK
jgi:hypothetical protein